MNLVSVGYSLRRVALTTVALAAFLSGATAISIVANGYVDAGVIPDDSSGVVTWSTGTTGRRKRGT